MSNTAPLSALTLEAVTAELETAFAAGDPAHALELLDRNPLEAWFGLRPDRLFEMLQRLESASVTLPPVLGAIHRMMRSAGGGMSAPPPQAQADPALDTHITELIGNVGDMYSLRLQGRPVEALRITQQMSEAQGQAQTLFPTNGGLTLFSVLQGGLTGMLAGQFLLAEGMLAQAKLHPLVPTLPFLSRDAYLKSAVLHACFGDPAVALAELAIADTKPRTNSWIEPTLDAQADLARALVEAISVDEAIKILDAIPMNALGEMWPFYAYAVRTVFERAGQPEEAARRLRILDQANLPRVDGQGFTGSVIPSLLALGELVAGNQTAARETWQRVDSELTLSRLGDAMFALAAGNPRESSRIAVELRGETRSLRQLELWRLAVLALSLLLLDDEEGAAEVIETALGMPRGLSAEESGVFHARVQEFARERFDRWPSPTLSAVDSFTHMPLDTRGTPTARELEVLQGLSRGLTRDEIAKELFVSVNTVKAHQQSLYRKFDVSGRVAAVLEGQRRGLI